MASPFSGSSTRKAATWGADFNQDTLTAAVNRAAATKAEGLGYLDQYAPQTIGALNTGYDNAAANYANGIQKYQPWVDAGSNALTTYQGALGLGGDDARQQAVNAFQTSPGYQWNVDQALDQTSRKAAANGQLLSGNAATALQDRASNLANQEYSGWLNNVNGLQQQGLQASSAQAGLYKGMGDLDRGRGEDLANVYNTLGTQKASLAQWEGGQDIAGINNMTSNVLQLGQKAFEAGDTAAANKVQFGLKAAGAIAGIVAAPFTGGLSLIGTASSIGSMAGGK